MFARIMSSLVAPIQVPLAARFCLVSYEGTPIQSGKNSEPAPPGCIQDAKTKQTLLKPSHFPTDSLAQKKNRKLIQVQTEPFLFSLILADNVIKSGNENQDETGMIGSGERGKGSELKLRENKGEREVMRMEKRKRKRMRGKDGMRRERERE